MLTHAENETLTRVGPGTPMGALMRLYWIPFYLSADLVADAQPKRVKLLCEDLVAFRDTKGRVGLMDNACAHRGAPMMYGRNEDCGLRCVYHGWKFDVTGAITDMPAEPDRSRVRERVKIRAYPCVERNGVVWTYMGEGEPPPLPEFEWNLAPPENVHLSMRIQECNWLQALEGEIDSAHAPILHGRIDAGGSINKWIAARDLRPGFECLRQPFGLSIASRRKVDDKTNYWRVNQFVMPFYTLVPPQAKFPDLSGHAWVPMDDENTLCFMFSYHPSQPLPARTRELFREGHQGRETAHASVHVYEKRSPAEPYCDYWPKYTRANNYAFDYASQQTTFFSGLPGLWVQDGACQSGIMPIYDRTKENLTVSDTGIVMTRRLLLDAAAALRERGARPPSADDPACFMVRAVSLHLPSDAIWSDVGRPHMQARLGADFGYDLTGAS